MNIQRGEIYQVDLGQIVGSEQGGIRPVLIIQNNIGNKFSPTTIVACITSKMGKTSIPTHVKINNRKALPLNSIVLLEQIRTIDKTRLGEKIGDLSVEEMQEVNKAMKISFGL